MSPTQRSSRGLRANGGGGFWWAHAAPAVCGSALLAIAAGASRGQETGLSALPGPSRGGWTQANLKNPAHRAGHATAYDRARGVTVLFGGQGYREDPDYWQELGDTWEWNGSDWVQRHPATSPDPRAGHVMAYDSDRAVTVLFGGDEEMTDTWEWDGAEWTQRFPLVNPGPFYEMAMVYDAQRGVTVLFGEYQTWEWDGSTWTQRFPINFPISTGNGIMMAYDVERSRTVLVTLTWNSSETWEWDGDDWSQRVTQVQPHGGCMAHYLPTRAMAYDTLRHVSVLFGDECEFGKPPHPAAWEWDGTEWTERELSAAPPTALDFTVIYDIGRALFVWFGGAETVPGWHWQPGLMLGGETWEADPAGSPLQWALRATAGPVPRFEHGMAYDAARGVTVLFGGAAWWHPGTLLFLSDTWEWDGQAWLRRVPTTHPEGRYGLAMAYDALRNVVVLFGGAAGGGMDCAGDTWEWNGNAWSLRATDGPTARGWHTMAYDAGRAVTVLFGGTGRHTGPLGDTWEWDGATWMQRFPVNQPLARTDHAMVFDEARGVILLFGGCGDANGHVFYGDTWEWDGITWTMHDIPGPPARADHAMAYDAGRSTIVLFGGTDLPFSPEGYFGDAWELGTAGWVPRAGGPRPRFCHGMVYDTARSEAVLFGGEWWNDVFFDVCAGDTWIWNGAPGLAGDLNCDGVVNADDIDPFVLLLTDASAYLATHPTCDALNADCNGDGAVNFDDINAFLAILSGG